MATGLAAYDPNKIINSLPTVDDSMANQVTALASKDSGLNRMAATEGLKVANRRGLLNSSMAVDASQDAVLKNVLPIAGQDAQTAANRNAAARAFEYGLTAQQQQQGWQTGERIGGQQFQTGERRETQTWQSGENAAQREWATDEAGLDRDLQQLLQSNQISSTELQQLRAIASTEGINAANNELQERMFNKELDFRGVQNAADRAAAKEQWKAEIDFNTTQGAANRALQDKIAKMNLSGTQQAGASQLLTNMSTMYQSEYSSIMNNTALDAATRTKFLTAAKNRYNTGLNLVEQMYNIDLKWA